MNERRMWKNILSLLEVYKIAGINVDRDILDIDAAENERNSRRRDSQFLGENEMDRWELLR